MARIAGIDLPKEKRGVISLTYIYGIGRSTAQQILNDCKVDENIKVQAKCASRARVKKKSHIPSLAVYNNLIKHL